MDSERVCASGAQVTLEQGSEPQTGGGSLGAGGLIGGGDGVGTGVHVDLDVHMDAGRGRGRERG